MVNKKMKVIVKLERDAQNFFFVKVLYGFLDSKEDPKTVYAITDEGLKDNIIALSYMVLQSFPFSRDFGITMVVLNPKNGYCYSGIWADYKRSDNVIVGTTPITHFEEINCLVRFISKTIKENQLGDFYVQYNDKILKEEEFYDFQDKLSIDTE